MPGDLVKHAARPLDTEELAGDPDLVERRVVLQMRRLGVGVVVAGHHLRHGRGRRQGRVRSEVVRRGRQAGSAMPRKGRRRRMQWVTVTAASVRRAGRRAAAVRLLAIGVGRVRRMRRRPGLLARMRVVLEGRRRVVHVR